jgi:hypothetical protein
MQTYKRFDRARFHTSSVRSPLYKAALERPNNTGTEAFAAPRRNKTESISEWGDRPLTWTNDALTSLKMSPAERSNANSVNRLRH